MSDKPFYEAYGEKLLATYISNKSTDVEKLEKYNVLEKLVNENIPQRLYRYRSCNELNFDALKNNRIYFNNPKNFNDPHDCLVYIDIDHVKRSIQQESAELKNLISVLMNDKDRLTEVEKAIGTALYKLLTDGINNLPEGADFTSVSTQIDYFTQVVEREVVNDCKDTVKIFRETPQLACFCSELLNPIMWSYYADYHKGFALEYESLSTEMTACPPDCKTFSSCKDYPLNCSLYPVVYTDVKFDATNFAIYQSAVRLYKQANSPLDLYKSDYDQLSYRKANIFKAKNWKHENEWRMELICSNPKRNWVTAKPSAVYVGAKVSDVNKSILLHFANSNGIKAFQMDEQPDNIEYKMHINPIL